MFSQFFKQATAEKRKRAKAKELERVRLADKEALEEEKALLKGKHDEEDKPKKKRAKTVTEEEETEKKETKKRSAKKEEMEEEEEDDILADNSDAEGEKKKKKKKKRKVNLTSEEVAQVWKELVAGTFDDSEEEKEEAAQVAPSFSPEECKIFVGGISDSEDKIRAFFGKHGTIKFVVSHPPLSFCFHRCQHVLMCAMRVCLTGA